MTSDVNWWLIALAFVLGGLVTLAFMVRRVSREVPVYGALGRGPAAEAGPAAEPDVERPYGAGSLRLGPDAAVPAGYTVKGNEDSMLYHTPESPSYEQTIAEIWFTDEETAKRAGFAPWHKGTK